MENRTNEYECGERLICREYTNVDNHVFHVCFKARDLKWNHASASFSPSLNPKSLKQAALLSKCSGWKPFWFHGSASHMEPV